MCHNLVFNNYMFFLVLYLLFLATGSIKEINKHTLSCFSNCSSREKFVHLFVGMISKFKFRLGVCFTLILKCFANYGGGAKSELNVAL